MDQKGPANFVASAERSCASTVTWQCWLICSQDDTDGGALLIPAAHMPRPQRTGGLVLRCLIPVMASESRLGRRRHEWAVRAGEGAAA